MGLDINKLTHGKRCEKYGAESVNGRATLEKMSGLLLLRPKTEHYYSPQE